MGIIMGGTRDSICTCSRNKRRDVDNELDTRRKHRPDRCQAQLLGKQQLGGIRAGRREMLWLMQNDPRSKANETARTALPSRKRKFQSNGVTAASRVVVRTQEKANIMLAT